VVVVVIVVAEGVDYFPCFVDVVLVVVLVVVEGVD
jgi:hypothetical protein